MSISSKLAARVTSNLESFDKALEAFLGALPLSKDWVQHDWLISEANRAQSLLTGAKIALLEAGAAWAIGSNRGAASSLRAYIENAFAWLYYKDHPVEFRAVAERKIDLMLPKAIQSYIKTIDDGFEKAYSMLSPKQTRDSEYFYTAVSQFVHAHPSFTERHLNIEETAVSVPRDAGFLKISSMADEFISDNYLTFYRTSWGDVPKSVQENASSRLGRSLRRFLDVT